MDGRGLDICLIMGLYPREKYHEIERDSIYGIQNAANVFQWNIVKGLFENGVKSIELINSIYIGSYPRKYRQAFIPSYRFAVQEGVSGKNIGFLNLPVIKEIGRFKSIKKSLKEWALNGKDNKVVIAYAATYPMTKALSYIKDINPNIKTCLVVPDLPVYMNLSQSKTSLLHHIKDKIVAAEMLKADCYVLLTEQMKDMIDGADKKPATIVEGMSSVGRDERANHDCSDKLPFKYFLYTGTLNYQYGIMNLLDSYESAETGDVHLVICGEGEASEEIRKREKNNDRIHFLGCCSHEKAMELQKGAFALVNPRCNEGEYTKYSFPSKIMEYMSSGRPTIAYLLDGMPKEYSKYIVCIEEKPDGIRSALEYVVHKGEDFCETFGKVAREFVLDKKNCKSQMKKVLEMLSKESNVK